MTNPSVCKFVKKVWLFSQFQVFYSCLVHSKVHFLNGLVTPTLLVFYWPSLNYCLFMLSWWPYQKWESANSRVEKDEFRCIKIWAVPRVMFEYSYTVPSFYCCCCLLLAFHFCSYVVVYNRNHLFGLGPILKPKLKIWLELSAGTETNRNCKILNWKE